MSNGEKYEVVMPKLGLIMTEARLAEWYKQDGDWVEAGEPLFSLESDKSIIDIEAPTAGLVIIRIPAGETVPVMTPVAYIVDEDTHIPETTTGPTLPALQEAPIKKDADQIRASAAQPSSSVRATPKARTLARQSGIDLTGIRGSGLRGMVVVADLDQITQLATVDATPIARKMAADYDLDLRDLTGTGTNDRITRADVTGALATIIAQSTGTSKRPSLPLTGLRGFIAERLTASWQERPQVTLTTEVDATNLVSARQQLIAETGQKVSFNTFFLLAAARALQEQPHVNVCLTSSGLVNLHEINIGIAVDTERGLLVPVVKNVDTKPALVLDTEINELAQRALSGKSLPDELTGGPFTITNLGAFGIDAFTPIINPPEAAVLGIGRISPRPFAVGRQLEVRDTVTLSLSFDHRLLDGAPAARFLQRISALIERPIVLTTIDHGTE